MRKKTMPNISNFLKKAILEGYFEYKTGKLKSFNNVDDLIKDLNK